MKRYLALPLILIVVFLLPLRLMIDLRNNIAYRAIESDFVSISKLLYKYSKWQKDPLATNNWLVLDYSEKRDDPAYTKEQKRQNSKEMHLKLKALRPSKLAAAEYNLALFNYKCRPNSKCFNIGMRRFQTAANLDDPLAKNTLIMMERRMVPQSNKAKRVSLLKQAADKGEPYAAYRYARHIYRDDPIQGQNYGLIAAQAGMADAQFFLGASFERSDSEYWLQQAASNKTNRNLAAATLLGERYQANGETKKAIKWYKKAIEPRGGFQHQLVIHKDGLRWRSLQFTRAADANSSNKAAYNLALLQGKTATADSKEFSENMRQASLVGWVDSELIMAQLAYQDAPFHAKKMQAKNLITANLKYFDNSSYGKLLANLRPMIASGDIRYVTELDLSKWTEEMERGKGADRENVKENHALMKQKCKAAQRCFLVNKAISLSAGMNGSHSAVFVIPKKVKAPSVGKSHNTYVFLGIKPRQVTEVD